MVARAQGGGRRRGRPRVTSRAARASRAIACGLMVAVVAAMPGSLLAFAYRSEVAEPRRRRAAHPRARARRVRDARDRDDRARQHRARARRGAHHARALPPVVSLACVAPRAGRRRSARPQLRGDGDRRRAPRSWSALVVAAARRPGDDRGRSCRSRRRRACSRRRRRRGRPRAACLPRFGRLLTPLVAGGLAVVVRRAAPRDARDRRRRELVRRSCGGSGASSVA